MITSADAEPLAISQVKNWVLGIGPLDLVNPEPASEIHMVRLSVCDLLDGWVAISPKWAAPSYRGPCYFRNEATPRPSVCHQIDHLLQQRGMEAVDIVETHAQLFWIVPNEVICRGVEF